LLETHLTSYDVTSMIYSAPLGGAIDRAGEGMDSDEEEEAAPKKKGFGATLGGAIDKAGDGMGDSGSDNEDITRIEATRSGKAYRSTSETVTTDSKFTASGDSDYTGDVGAKLKTAEARAGAYTLRLFQLNLSRVGHTSTGPPVE
jgi:hypothetical protein